MARVLTTRVSLAVAAAVVILAGLTVHDAGFGSVGSFIADGLYAALVTLIVALIWPRLLPWWAATIAAAISTAIELFQLTPIPSKLGDQAPWIRLILGTTFSPFDLIAYLLGAFAVGVLARLTLSRR